MPISLLGQKVGMTRVFAENGDATAVTVIQFESIKVTQIRTPVADGYSAIQVATRETSAARLNKPSAGHLRKSEAGAFSKLYELRLDEAQAAEYALGAELTVEAFEVGQKVDVAGTTIGKGFAGAIKRHHFNTQDATHGNSLSHRAPGSIGQRQTPGRVWKGKKMCGHLGAAQRSAMNLSVVKVDPARRLMYVQGAVPGPKGGQVLVSPAAKAKKAVKS
jgi:large subunit ribosomal protein L3